MCGWRRCADICGGAGVGGGMGGCVSACVRARPWPGVPCGAHARVGARVSARPRGARGATEPFRARPPPNVTCGRRRAAAGRRGGLPTAPARRAGPLERSSLRLSRDAGLSGASARLLRCLEAVIARACVAVVRRGGGRWCCDCEAARSRRRVRERCRTDGGCARGGERARSMLTTPRAVESAARAYTERDVHARAREPARA